MASVHLTGPAFLNLFPPLKAKAATRGGEYAGPCPFCKAGDDRLVVWPELGKWTCRICQDFKQRSDVDYVLLRDYGRIVDGAAATKDEQIALAKAFEALGAAARTDGAATIADPTPKPCEPPNELWQRAGNAFWEYAFCQLWDVPEAERASHPGHRYLATRGISDDVLAWAWVGYNPTTLRRPADKWGIVRPEYPADTWDKEVWLPAGLVFPWIVDGVLWKLVIRRDDAKGRDNRYIAVEASGNPPYGLHTVERGRPLVLVEGVFDQLAVCQATGAHTLTGGECIGCVATGTSWAQNWRWSMAFGRASAVLLAYDNEPPKEGDKLSAGDKAAAYWQDVLGSRAKRHAPARKDCGEMAQAGDDVLAWLRSGL